MRLFGTEVSKHYIIASLQRTGSYLLCECLQNTNVVGHPTEAISPENKPIFSKWWGIDPNLPLLDYIAEAVKRGTGSNRVFGVKMHWSQIDWTRRQLGIGEPKDGKILDHLFPDARYIHLTRADIRGQAISSYRAYWTNEWWRIAGEYTNDMITNPDPPYDSEAIRKWERRFKPRQQRWLAYFAERGIAPCHVEYEDLAADWRAETRRCLTYLGEDPAAVDAAPEPRLIRQADAVTRAWRKRLDREDAELSVRRTV